MRCRVRPRVDPATAALSRSNPLGILPFLLSLSRANRRAGTARGLRAEPGQWSGQEQGEGILGLLEARVRCKQKDLGGLGHLGFRSELQQGVSEQNSPKQRRFP